MYKKFYDTQNKNIIFNKNKNKNKNNKFLSYQNNQNNQNNISNNNIIDNKIKIQLKKPRIPKDISIEDYYNTNKNKYPILYKIARGYLIIITTSIFSKSIFSKIDNIVTKSKNRLLLSIIKKIIVKINLYLF